MAERVFFFNTLHEHVSPAEYEAFVREVDYPSAKQIPEIVNFVVTRLEGHVLEDDSPPYQYLEVIDVTSIEAYREALKRPEFQDFMKEFNKYVAEAVAVWGEVIEE